MKPLAQNVLIQERYLIVHLIGKGGMGEVYLAVDQRLGSAVALKRTFFSDDELLANAFEREARTLANLRHPVLPKVSDHFIEGENQFLVMEHITGDDLSKRLEKTGQSFPLSWVLFWADQLLDALHYLHTNTPPIIHRDIKPQNLKLTNDNHIVLLDFGLSKNSVNETKHSSTGSVVGYTPHYAPMEQIRGTGTNFQSDLYSLSATLYQLLTNAVPPDALTRADSLLSGLPDPIKPLNEVSKEVSPEVSEVILRGMEVSQDKRHSSAREMQKALRDAYSKLQTAMSANTVVFGLKNGQNESAEPSGDEVSKTPISAPSIAESVPPGNFADVRGDQPPRPALIAEPDPEVTIQLSQQEAEALRNSQAADEQPLARVDELDENSYPQQEEQKPSDIKTEVLLAGQSPAIQAVQDGQRVPDDDYSPASEAHDSEKIFDTSENFAADNDFDTGEDFSLRDENSQTPEFDFSTKGDFHQDDSSVGEGTFTPDATSPLINFESGPAREDVFADQDDSLEEDFSDAGNSLASERDGDSEAFFTVPGGADIEPGVAGGTVPMFRPETNEASGGIKAGAGSARGTGNAGAKRKSGGKTLAVIAGIAALLILVLGTVGGVAWYFMNQRTSTIDPTPTPSQTVEATATPTEIPVVVETNTNNQNSATINVNANSNRAIEVQPVEPTPRRVTPTRIPPTRVPPTPAGPTPRPPTPKPTNRTGIIH